MKTIVTAIVCAVLVGVAIGRVDALLLSQSRGSEEMWLILLLAFGGAAATIPAALLSKSLAGAAGVAVISLAIELAVSVVAKGCTSQSDCAQGVVESLIWPLLSIYAWVALPVLGLIWWVRNRPKRAQ